MKKLLTSFLVVVFMFAMTMNFAFAAADSSIININLDVQAGIEVDCSEDTSGIIDSDHVSHEDGLATMGAIVEDGEAATASQNCLVRTNETHGYSLAIKGSGTAVDATTLQANDDVTHTIPAIAASTPADWSITDDMNASGWGYRLASSSASHTGAYDTAWGSDDTYAAGHWAGVDAIDVTIGAVSDHTANTGNTETLIFGAEVGTQKIQPTGMYVGQVTVTATTL